MSDWEKAIAHWLPEVWTPGRKCEGMLFPEDYHARDECPYICAACGYATAPMNAGLASRIIRDHDRPCPAPSRDLGFRLLDAMLNQSEIGFQKLDGIVFCNSADDTLSTDSDLLTAITKAAAALASQKEEKE